MESVVAQTQVIMLKSPFTEEALGDELSVFQPAACCRGTTKQMAVVNACVVLDDLCGVIRYKMLFSLLFN